MAGLKSLRKGKLGEYKARKHLESMGYEVVWTAEDPKKPDLEVKRNFIDPLRSKEIERWEVKYQASVSKRFYEWLSEKGADALMIKRVNSKDGRSYPWLQVRVIEEKKIS